MTRTERCRLLYGIIRKGERRNPASNQSMISATIEWFIFVICCLYLIASGIVLAYLAKDESQQTIFGAMPLVLLLDFSMRFVSRKRQIDITPYRILPVSLTEVIDCSLIAKLTSNYNFLWLFLFASYSITASLICDAPPIMFIGITMVCQLLIATNCLWQSIIYLLVNKHPVWWTLPAVVYLFPLIMSLPANNGNAFDYIYHYCCQYGFTPTSIISYAVLTIILFLTNRIALLKIIKEEANDTNKSKRNETIKISFLDQLGITGEYMKLEIKSAIRNKAIRRNYIHGLILMLLLSTAITFASVYSEDMFSQTLWFYYCFIFFGVVNLSKIMEPEGNYIDILMTHKESIYELLKAKYYFYCCVLILPLLILSPTVFTGKVRPLLVIACLLTACGPTYFILFQLAVINKQTMPLTSTVTGRPNANNPMSTIISICVFIVPAAIIHFTRMMFGENAALTTIAAIGGIFTIAHRLWLYNIYKRIMRRKHENLEGFHATKR